MEFLKEIIPSIGVIALFWFTIRSVINADRREREAEARAQSQEVASE